MNEHNHGGRVYSWSVSSPTTTTILRQIKPLSLSPAIQVARVVQVARAAGVVAEPVGLLGGRHYREQQGSEPLSGPGEPVEEAGVGLSW